MKHQKFSHRSLRRMVAGTTAIVLGLSGMILAPGYAGSVTQTNPVSTAATCTVSFEQVASPQGFAHPGVGMTASELENVRDQIAVGAEPWTSYFDQMKRSASAARDVTSSNRSSADPTKPDSVALNSQGLNGRFIADGLKAYTQALLYVFTGEQVYRENAMAIIRIWEQMDPEQFALFPDAHIHTGIPLNRMVMAAEILRYGSCETDTVPWTDQDTEKLSANLITPVIETFQSNQNHFMNQHNYPLLGAMAGHIFMDDAAGYAQDVEWFTVNSTANDQGFNGSVARLFRLMETNDATGEPLAEPRVQHVEMGRDQAHGGGDITNAYMLSRMLMSQGTEVDPALGTISQADDAVGPYEFLDDRILNAADYFWQFMLGHETPWVPMAYAISPDGTIRDTYDHISNAYRGRYNTASFWDLYYYYTYERGVDLSQRAPYFAKAFEQRLPLEYYYGGNVARAWDSPDAGGDFWLHIPAEAAGSSVPKEMPSATILEIEDRFTAIDGTVTQESVGAEGYVRLLADEQGSTMAYRNGSTGSKTISLRVRTDGPATLDFSFGFSKQVELPNTNGQWRSVVLQLANSESVADIFYVQAKGTGAKVDIDHLNINAKDTVTPDLSNLPNAIIGIVGQAQEVDLSTAGSNSYSAPGLPSGASLNENSGKLTWTAQGTGSARVLLTADNGSAIASVWVDLVAVEDRAAAVAAAGLVQGDLAAFTKRSREAYEAALQRALSAIEGSEQDFAAALRNLLGVTAALLEISPETSNGSLNYPSLLAASTAGDRTALLVDQDNQTGTVYGQAVELGHVFDFGPFAKVQASKFGMQSNIFEDRLANSAVFGSNDGTNWDRLTPEVTTMTQDYQELTVSPDLVDNKYQYIKIQILKPLPDVLYGNVRGLFEMTEFHIYGQRTESLGDIDSVTLSAPGALKGRVVAGDTVQLDVHAAAPIDRVEATLAGVPAQVVKVDDENWTATAQLPQDVEVGGLLPFKINHFTSHGQQADPIETTSDGSTLFVSTDTGVIDEHLKAAQVFGDNGLAAQNLTLDAQRLFDHDLKTHSDTRVVGSRASLVWDLGAGAQMSISGADVLVRQDQYGTSRLSNLRFEGSNDREEWTALTTSVVASPDWQRLRSLDSGEYRYLRLTNGNIINVAEIRLFGTHESAPSSITSAHISSSNPLGNYAVDGDQVFVDIAVSEEPSELTVKIDGRLADISKIDSGKYRAAIELETQDRVGQYLTMSIDHKTASGKNGVPLTAATDNSVVRMGTDSGLITNVLELSTLVTLQGLPDPSTLSRPENLFDSNLATATDARLVDGEANIVFDLGESNLIDLERVELALRQDTYGTSRLKDLKIMGSTDLAEWTTLVDQVKPTLAWQEFDVETADSTDQNQGFRYLRITNRNIMGIAELRLYGSAGPKVEHDGSTKPPGKAVVSSTSGWATGQHDGNFTVKVDLWHGENARVIEILENGEVVGSKELTMNSPQAQSASFEFSGKSNGTYEYVARLTNSSGVAESNPLKVKVTDANPGKPTLSSNNYRSAPSFELTADLWWGTNATSYVFYENGNPIAEGDLAAASPKAQKATVKVTDKAPGTYLYVVEFKNAAGSTTSAELKVRVS